MMRSLVLVLKPCHGYESKRKRNDKHADQVYWEPRALFIERSLVLVLKHFHVGTSKRKKEREGKQADQVY